MAEIHKWRVVIIMAHDGESSFEYEDLKQSILGQSGFENISYIIFDYNQKTKEISIKSPVITNNGRVLEKMSITEKFIGKDFYEKSTLIDFLRFVKDMETIENGVTNREIKYHYFMITWGHGAGLFYFPSGKIEGLVKKIGINPEDILRVRALKQEFYERLLVYTQFVKNNSGKNVRVFAEKSFPFLTINMFRNEKCFIKKSQQELYSIVANFNKNVAQDLKVYSATDLNFIFEQGIGKVDVYFALNCFTQMIETGFELRRTVKMMVAPQTTMPLTGINYKEVFERLEIEPSIELRELSEVIKTSYQNKYTPCFKDKFKRHYPEFDFSIVSFACNFLNKHELLVESLNELTDLIKRIYTQPDLKVYKRKVGDARKLCGDLTPGNNFGIIDLNNFLMQLQLQLPNVLKNDITAIKDEFESIKDFTLASIKKPDADNSVPGKPTNNPSFLSFFAPAFKGGGYVIKYLLEKYTTMNSEYSMESEWDDFVRFFYRNTSRSFRR